MDANRSVMSGVGEEALEAGLHKADWCFKARRNDNVRPVSDQKIVEYYDCKASKYDDELIVRGYGGPTIVANAVHKYLQGKLDARILDIGAGTGLVMEEIRKLANYNNADGLDPADGMMEEAREKGLYKNVLVQYFHVGSGIEHDSYDMICSSGAFVPGHLRSACLREMCDIVKPSGYIVVNIRSDFLTDDVDLKLIRPTIDEMVEQGRIEKVEEQTFNNYLRKTDGTLFVLKKL